jgi:hypothetical protein
MNDRELLAMAAKVSDSGACWSDGRGGFYIGLGTYTPVRWDPLSNDGDAFRLALACALNVAPRRASLPGVDRISAHERDGDLLPATRRAIVRAAAAIGQAQAASGVDAGAAGAQPSDAAK